MVQHSMAVFTEEVEDGEQTIKKNISTTTSRGHKKEEGETEEEDDE